MIDGQKRSFLKFQDVRGFLDSVPDENIHTKRGDSLANATLGVMTGASLGVALIGKSLAQARGLLPKHAVKQVDRLLSNRRLEAVFATWVPEMVGARLDIVVAGPTLMPRAKPPWRSSWSRPGDAAGLAQRTQGRLEGRPQRLRGRRPAPAGRGAARRPHRDYPGRLRRHQAVRVPHGTGLWLRHPAEGQHQGQRGRRDDPPGGRVDWPRRAERASCATRRLLRRTARSARPCACTPGT